MGAPEARSELNLRYGLRDRVSDESNYKKKCIATCKFSTDIPAFRRLAKSNDGSLAEACVKVAAPRETVCPFFASM